MPWVRPESPGAAVPQISDVLREDQGLKNSSGRTRPLVQVSTEIPKTHGSTERSLQLASTASPRQLSQQEARGALV